MKVQKIYIVDADGDGFAVKHKDGWWVINYFFTTQEDAQDVADLLNKQESRSN